MKLQVYICEDKPANQDELKTILADYFKHRHIPCLIEAYIYGKALIDDFVCEYIHPDILFINIHLKDGNGIDICKKLRDLNYNGIILFITADKTRAVEAFDVDARGYLLKPFELDKIHATLDRILSANHMRSYYTITTRYKIVNILRSQILYIESYKTTCIIHCTDNIEYTVYKKLSDIQTELDDDHFLRCHQSYLVNMDYITESGESFTLTTGDTIPIRRRNIKDIKNKYKEFLE